MKHTDHNPGQWTPGCPACEYQIMRSEQRDAHPWECPAKFPEYDEADCTCGIAAAAEALAASISEVWCDKCDKAATTAIALTNGTLAHRCSTHAWLLRAPSGRRAVLA